MIVLIYWSQSSHLVRLNGNRLINFFKKLEECAAFEGGSGCSAGRGQLTAGLEKKENELICSYQSMFWRDPVRDTSLLWEVVEPTHRRLGSPV